MLYVCTDIQEFHTFKFFFKETYGKSTFLDLSTVAASKLAEEGLAVVDHHSDCCVFLGYLEPGWMLEGPHQVQLRKLFRKFPVAVVCKYVDSIPFSWKNGTEIVYTKCPLNQYGSPNTINDGCTLQHQPEI